MGLNKEYFLGRGFSLLSSSPTICLSEEDQFGYDDWINFINNNATSLNDKDKIYIKNCAIPEHKINLYYPNITIVSDWKTADVIIVSDKLLNKIFDFDVAVPAWVDSEDNSYNWKRVSAKELLKCPEFDVRYRNNHGYYKDAINHGYVYVKENYYGPKGKTQGRFKNIATIRVKTLKSFGSAHNLVGTQKQLLYLQTLIEAKSVNKKFILESQLTTQFNHGSSNINEDSFDLISKMLDSQSKEEWQLARELMSNVEVNNSRVYLLILLNKYNDKFIRISSFKNSNYKALTNALGIKQDELRLNWVNFYKTIIKKMKFSDEEIEVLKKNALNNLNAKFGNQGIIINDISFI